MKKNNQKNQTQKNLNQGCRKDNADNHQSTIADTTNFSIADAKNWFNGPLGQAGSHTTQSTTTQFSLHRLTVSWEQARSFSTGNSNFWVAPAEGKPQQGKYISGYRKIAFVKNKSGSISARILEIIPDGIYLQSRRKALNTDFTGRLFIYDQDYHLLGGRIYINGKVAGQIRQQANTSQNTSLHTDNMQTIYDCQWVDSNYINAEGELVVYSEQICTSTTIDTGDPFDDGSGGYLGQDTGSGNGSTSAPPVSNLPGESGPAVNPKSLMESRLLAA